MDQVVLARVELDPRELPGHPRHNFPPLDLKYIQAALTNGQQCGPPILDGWLNAWPPEQLAEQILQHRPAIAVIKAATPCLGEAVTVGTILRAQGVITVAVGQQVSHVFHQAWPGWEQAFDIPVLGDPEEQVPTLVRQLREGVPFEQVAGPYRDALARGKSFLVDNPDQLPRPHFSREELTLYDFMFPVRGVRRRRWGYVLSGWGCPHRCLHCSGVIRTTSGSQLRMRDPKLLVDEIAGLLDAGAEAIIFEDDTLLTDRRYFLAICHEIVRRKLRFPWIAHARADHLDGERVAAAAEAGALLFKVGVESNSPRVIEALGKTADGKSWPAKVERAFALLNRHHIGSVALFLLGSPGETVQDVEDSIELAIRIKADYVQVQIFSVYPDSPYFACLSVAQREQLEAGGQYHYACQVWSPSEIVPEELLALQARFYRRFYLRPTYMLQHLRRFWRFYFSSRSALHSVGYMAAWVAGLRNRAR